MLTTNYTEILLNLQGGYRKKTEKVIVSQQSEFQSLPKQNITYI